MEGMGYKSFIHCAQWSDSDIPFPRAVVMRVVQELLNEKIAQRFPTAILLLDFYMQLLVIVFYTYAVKQSMNRRVEGAEVVSADFWSYIWLYVGATYFLMREIIQIVSLISLKALHIWVYEPGNWLNGEYWISDSSNGDTFPIPLSH
jgi:hypothetical protein